MFVGLTTHCRGAASRLRKVFLKNFMKRTVRSSRPRSLACFRLLSTGAAATLAGERAEGSKEEGRLGSHPRRVSLLPPRSSSWTEGQGRRKLPFLVRRCMVEVDELSSLVTVLGISVMVLIVCYHFLERC